MARELMAHVVSAGPCTHQEVLLNDQHPVSVAGRRT